MEIALTQELVAIVDAQDYDVAALEIHGEFARANFSLQEMEI